MNDQTPPSHPQTLDEMLAAPGVYQIGLKGSPFFTRVEVDEDLVCHQLTPSMERDGVLPRDGWRHEERGYTIVRVVRG